MRGKLLGGRYRITRRIGEGGMAYVYLAKDEKLSRQVAIKILHKHMADNADIRQRFFQEAHAISALEHPNILKLYDFSGKNSDELWMVMEVLQGLNLNEYIHTFPGNWLHPIIASMIAREILKALQTAHQEGLIHRDVKPENVFVLNGGGIKLMDFGIVKNTRSNSITMTGTFMGSPSYMSPEQIRGKSVDHRSDIYSLGVLFYEIVTGRLPYSGNTTHDVVMKICEGKFKEPREHVPNLPDDLNKIICKAMSKHPMHRYQEARTFARDLDIFLRNHSFEESHIELERYFADKHKFEDRLRGLDFTNKGTLHTIAPVKGKAKKPQTPPKPPKTTRTRVMSDEEQVKASVQQQNVYGVENPKPKNQIPVPPAPPAAAKAPRRDRSIPKRNSYPHVSRKLKFTQQHDALSPTVMDPGPYTAPARQRVDRVQKQQRPGQLNKPRVRPRAPKRRPRQQVVYHRSAYQPGPAWGTPLIGVVLVGIIGLLSIIGFGNLIDRMPDKKPSPSVRPQPTQLVRPTLRPQPTRQAVRPTARPQPTRAPEVVNTPRPTPRIERPQPTRRAVERPQPTRRAPAPTQAPRPTAVAATPVPPVATPVPTVAATPKPVATVAKVKLSSRPAAEIYIDGKRMGTTVDRTLNSGWIEVKPGRHRIELRRTGYKSYSTRLRFEAGESRSIPTITLQTDTNFMLTLSSNQKPVRVTLTGVSDKSRRSFTLRGSPRGQVLGAGRYKARFEYKGRVIERTITLGGSQSTYNLNVDF